MVKWVGILNLTPDSFFDGGQYNQFETALSQLEHLIHAGASVIDVGAESTRPGATLLSQEEEWQRLFPILPTIIEYCHQHQVKVSIDSYHSRTVAEALDMGVDWINDVSNAKNNEIIKSISAYKEVKYVVMHSLTVPADPSIIVDDQGDIIHYMHQWMEQMLTLVLDQGLDEKQLIVDPGIGFNKNHKQSLTLIEHINQLTSSSIPVLIGHSNKRCLGALLGEEKKAEATLVTSLWMAARGVCYIRVHDVAQHQAAKNEITRYKEEDWHGIFTRLATA